MVTMTQQAPNSGLTRFSVQDKSILITGATGSLGSVAARALADAGARLTLTGGNAAGLAELVEDAGIDNAVVVERRPETPADAQAMVAAAVAHHGRLDGVLVASGMNHVAPITEMAVEDFDKVMDANLRGAWLVCQAAGRVLLEQGDGGSIVLVSSVRGALGHPAGYSAYCPAKAGTDLLAKSLAAEWGADGIRVNALAPTVFRSELTEWMYADDGKGRATREAMFARIPLRRFAEPEDFVGALIYLLSDASSFYTGQVMYLDGGYTAC
ncbi:oxidoreductase [Mycobacterium kansasii]|uniref:SDR family NAD(P)-dependent oxidoreductase n=1 Tax=Mycobacterium kansasii TaxID=1768 RepID=UPI000CDE293E|nr:SDR family oxidoreductase [Mycobacterium kansasii]POX97017.1 oxidoreductase [Mycobacterium kansasii]POY22200.1 oxidoreductase [Mycobacterium kansasii]POY30165.1 oxidoreductase [Mycobacterium kansasii]